MYPYQDPASKSEVKAKPYDDASLVIGWALLVPFAGIVFAAYLYQRGPTSLLIAGLFVDSIEQYLLPKQIFGIIYNKFYLQFFICGSILFWFCFIVTIMGIFLKWPKGQALILSVPMDYIIKPLIVALLPMLIILIIVKSTYSNTEFVNWNVKFPESMFIIFCVVAYPGTSGAILGMWIINVKLIIFQPK